LQNEIRSNNPSSSNANEIYYEKAQEIEEFKKLLNEKNKEIS
jgi:hypothetical protein